MLPSLDDYLNTNITKHANTRRYSLILSKDIDDRRILQSDWMWGTNGHTQPQLIIWDVTFPSWLTPCKKLRYYDSFQRYWWSKILESDWLRAFWATTEEPRLCQVYRFQRIIKNIVMYHFQGENDTSVDKFFGKSQKTLFWRNFWAFLPKWDFFLKNLASSVYEFITLKIL